MVRNQIEQQKLDLEKQMAPAKMQLEQSKINLEAMKIGNAHTKTLLENNSSQQELALDARKVDAENVKTMSDIANKHMDRTLQGAKHILDHEHKMTQVLKNNVLPLPTGELSDENETP